MDTAKLQAFLQGHRALIADFQASALAFQREKNQQRPLAQRHDDKRLKREVLAMVAAFVATIYHQEQPAASKPHALAYRSWLRAIEQTQADGRQPVGD